MAKSENEEMSVFRSRDKWRAEVFVDGRRVAGKSGFARQREAKTWHDEKLRALAKGEVERVFTFEELLAQFRAWHLKGIRPGTRTRYEVDIKERLEPTFRFMRLDRITGGMIEEAKAKWATEIAPKSVNNCLHTLRLMLNRAVKWKMLGESPYATESLDVPEKPYPWWSEGQDIERFLVAAKASRYFPVYLLALETGLRYGEIIGLTFDDVDLEQGVIHVHRQWLEREGRYGPTKHGRERWVDFDPNSELGETLRGASRQSGGVVFPTATGAIPTKGGVAHKYFKAAIRRAGVPEICFHGLRHTFASWYMIRHDNVWDLSAILGHSSIKTTMRYAHHSKRARRKPLDLASITHISRTVEGEKNGTNEKHREKEWRDGRDLNPRIPKMGETA